MNESNVKQAYKKVCKLIDEQHWSEGLRKAVGGKYYMYGIAIMEIATHCGCLIDWVNDDEEETMDEMGVFGNALPGSTYRTQCVIACRMIIDAINRAGKGHYPFQSYCAEEWLWADLVEESIEPVIGDSDINSIGKLQVLQMSGGIDLTDYESQEFACRLGLEDGPRICRMFYPHAWTDYTRGLRDMSYHETIAEFSFIFDDMCRDYFKLIEDDSPSNTSKPYKKTKEKPVIIEKKQIKKAQDKYLYLMKCEKNNTYKIGVSKNPQVRESTLQDEKPSIKIVGKWQSLGKYEAAWHQYFASQRLRGEWFNLSPSQVRFFCSQCAKGICNEILNKEAS